jgi:hypothetical protein
MSTGSAWAAAIGGDEATGTPVSIDFTDFCLPSLGRDRGSARGQLSVRPRTNPTSPAGRAWVGLRTVWNYQRESRLPAATKLARGHPLRAVLYFHSTCQAHQSQW